MHLLLLGGVALFGLNCKRTERQQTLNITAPPLTGTFRELKQRGTSATSLKASVPCVESGLTVLSAGDLGQDPEGPGLGGAGPRAPVLRVLGDALPAGVRVSGHVVEVDVGVNDVFPGYSAGGQQWPLTKHLNNGNGKVFLCYFIPTFNFIFNLSLYYDLFILH